MPAVSGTLKGYDQLLNLVLDEAVEYLRGAGAWALCAEAVSGKRSTMPATSLHAEIEMPASIVAVTSWHLRLDSRWKQQMAAKLLQPVTHITTHAALIACRP